MGFKSEFNWALKLNDLEKKLEVGKEYAFSKDDYRDYPIDMPIDLIDQDWKALARVIIKSCMVKDGKTSGKYEIIKIYEGIEKDILSKYWKGIADYLKKK